MTTILVTGDITKDTTWETGNTYVIGSEVNVKPGVSLTINGTNVCFLDGFDYSLRFEPGSFLYLDNVKSFSVDSTYKPVTRANSGAWVFYGSRATFNKTIPLKGSRYNINKLSCNYIGRSSRAALTFVYVNEYESNINVIKVKNSVFGTFLNNSIVQYNQFGSINNTNTLILIYSNLLIFKKLYISGGNVTTGSLLESSLNVLQNSEFYINSTLAQTVKITTNDVRVPTTRPYATPYVVAVSHLSSRLNLYTSSSTKSIEDEGERVRELNENSFQQENPELVIE